MNKSEKQFVNFGLRTFHLSDGTPYTVSELALILTIAKFSGENPHKILEAWDTYKASIEAHRKNK